MQIRKVPFAFILALICTGALFLIGLALTSQSVPEYPGIDALSRTRASAIAFAAWAITAGLFTVALVVFAVAERHESGTRSVLRLPRTRTLLGWLVLALVLLTALALMDTGPKPQEPVAQETDKASQLIGEEEVAQPPRASEEPRSSGSKPAVRRPPTASSLQSVYAVVLAMIGLAGAVAALTLSRRQKRPEQAPVARHDESGDDQLINPAWTDEETLSAIQQESDPRIAVIMCYRLFQSVLEQAEVRIEEHHTPEECGRIAVRALKLQHRSVSRLVGLYSRARFSEHLIRESHKSAAMSEVRQIVAAVRDYMAQRAESIESAEATEPKGVLDIVASGPRRT